MVRALVLPGGHAIGRAVSEAIMRPQRRYDLPAREAIVRAVDVNRCDRGLLWIADLCESR